MKPQIAADAVPLLAAYVGKGTLIVSIMAGRTIGFLQQNLPTNTAIVRAIPNTPAAIGRGISGAVANARTSPRQRKQAADLLAAIGAVEWVSNEALMDAVTAVSGSGPAYVFLLAEAMTQAGIAAGLPAELAARLARETVAGAGELLRCSTLDAAALRRECDLARRHHRRGARRADGTRRLRYAADAGHRRRDAARQGIGGLSLP